MRPSRRGSFDSPEWIFQQKHDGFRALAYIENGTCRLISRNGHAFKGFRPLCEEIARTLHVKNAILDGELCCLGTGGRSLFNELLFRRGVPHFYAFDLLWLNSRDLRQWSLLRRKAKLRSILPDVAAPILFATHVDTTGMKLFAAACEHDLEGIVAKRKDSPYEWGERGQAGLEFGIPTVRYGVGTSCSTGARSDQPLRPNPPVFNIQTKAFGLE